MRDPIEDLVEASLAGLPTHPPEPCPWCAHCDRLHEVARQVVGAYMSGEDLGPAIARLEDLTGGQQ